MDEETFNSSDLEFEPAPVNPFSSAGKASIEAIIEHATTDRVASKKFAKQLQFTKGRPGTQYRNMLWFRRFESFREHSLKVSKDSVPTGEQIERFLSSIVALVRPTSNDVPSIEWLKGGLRHLLLSLVFHHSNFQLSTHERARIATTVDELVSQGKLTREPSRQKNWVGVFIMRKITTAMLVDALNMGTLNWDVTLSKVTSVVLTAALTARAGDIYTDRLDDQPLPYLCYQDIQLKLVGGDNLEHLAAEVVIRNEKSNKNKPKKNRRVVLHSLPDGADNCLCPIKLLLILALRSGSVEDKTVDEILSRARGRSDRSVRWIRPQSPVICALLPQAAALQPEKAANRTQVSRTLAEGGLLAGVVAVLASHDARRGSARDTANLQSKIKGLATEAVTATLGQSKQSYDRGITAGYVGAMTSDIWSGRVQEDFQDPFGLQISDKPLTKKRKFTSKEITEMCVAKDLDASDPRARQRVVYAEKKGRVKAWVNEELHQDNRVLLEQPSSATNTISGAKAAPQQEEDIDDVDFDCTTNLEDAIRGRDNVIITEEMEEAIFNQLESSTNSMIDCPHDPVEFVRFFSKINISSNQTLLGFGKKSQHKLPAYMGNSRDPVTLFVRCCTNVSRGCQYRSENRFSLTNHEKKCSLAQAD